MIDISVRELTKSFEIGSVLLDHFSFDVNSGERVAIMGRNGCGKTTLFRMLTGQLEPDSGEISIAKGKKIGLISQIPIYPEGYCVEDVLRTAFSELTRIKEKMDAFAEKLTQHAPQALLTEYDSLSIAFMAGGGYDMDVNVDKVCNGLGIPAAQRKQSFAALSGGEKTRVNLARLLLEKTDILLLDEPTNHLDMRSVEWLEEYILRFKGTVLTISHDRFFLDRIAQRIIEIHEGHAEFYNGNYSLYLEEKQARFDLQLKHYEQEQAKLKQLGFTLERMKGWATNNRILYRRAMSIQHRMDRIEKTGKPTREQTLRARFQQRDFFGDEVFSVKNFSMGFAQRMLFSDISLQVAGGERIALLGDNGTGKTTFLRGLLGELPVIGKIRFGPSVKWGYLPQTIHFDHPERTLYDTMLYTKNCTPQTARDRLGAFLFQGEDVFKTVGTLSGGEQSRLRLCMLMDNKINFLILDEPTNHLDISAKEWIECAIDEFEGTLLFVSHDRYFVDKFATRIWELADGTITDYPFGYQKYRAVKEHEKNAPMPQKDVGKEKKGKPKGGSKELEKQVRRLEREIQAQEDEITDLEKALSLAATDYQELVRITELRAEAEQKLEALFVQWEAAAAELEAIGTYE